MKTKYSIKSLISGMLAVVMTIGAIPSMSVFAAQVNEYIDPADVWIVRKDKSIRKATFGNCRFEEAYY